MTKQLAGAAVAVCIEFWGLLASYKGALWKNVAAWLAVTKEIKCSGCLFQRGAADINSLLFVPVAMIFSLLESSGTDFLI